jgi:hypothetical protein
VPELRVIDDKAFHFPLPRGVARDCACLSCPHSLLYTITMLKRFKPRLRIAQL